uniref:Uncharacterized protein n=1 Tax=Labrus bergylta TaxID=56723 RepID=A0A3Q3GG76_9LABR
SCCRIKGAMTSPESRDLDLIHVLGGPRLGSGEGSDVGPGLGSGEGSDVGPRLGSGEGSDVGPGLGSGEGSDVGPGLGSGVALTDHVQSESSAAAPAPLLSAVWAEVLQGRRRDGEGGRGGGGEVIICCERWRDR